LGFVAPHPWMTKEQIWLDIAPYDQSEFHM